MNLNICIKNKMNFKHEKLTKDKNDNKQYINV